MSFRIPAPRVLAQHALCPMFPSSLPPAHMSKTHAHALAFIFDPPSFSGGERCFCWRRAGSRCRSRLLSFCILSPTSILTVLQALFFFFPFYLSSPLPYLSYFLSRFSSLLFHSCLFNLDAKPRRRRLFRFPVALLSRFSNIIISFLCGRYPCSLKYIRPSIILNLRIIFSFLYSFVA